MFKKIFSNSLLLTTVFFQSGILAFEMLPKKPEIPIDNKMSSQKIKLGQQLYFDKRLSGDNSVSCQTCHDVNNGGVDHLPTSKGIAGQLGGRNAPTVLNAAYMTVQFWDGRAATLEDQAKGPVLNPIEMGMKDAPSVVEKIRAVKGYEKQFAKIFGGKEPVTYDNIAKAIAAYERTLIASNSPFDQYLAGKKSAMSKEALEGMNTFQSVGCVACHQGPNFAGPALPIGSGFFMRFPTYEGTEFDKKYGFSKDLGRFEATKDPSHKHMFRVASLRNVELTAPYFHNGSVASLDEAVRVMGKTQLNKDLTDSEVKSLVAFLKSLTSKFAKQKEPILPN